MVNDNIKEQLVCIKKYIDKNIYKTNDGYRLDKTVIFVPQRAIPELGTLITTEPQSIIKKRIILNSIGYVGNNYQEFKIECYKRALLLLKDLYNSKEEIVEW